MENVIYTEDNQRKIEKFILIIYSVYSLNMMIVFAGREMGGWVNFFLMFGLMFSWIMHIGKAKTYATRAKITAFMMQMSMVLYGIYVDDITRVLPIFGGFVVVLGLYGLPEVISITVFSITFIFGYHCLVLDLLAGASANEALRLFLQLANMYLVEYVMYIWTKRNNEGSSQLLGAIEELKAAESSKNDFLANVSHEIRTPINSICGMSEIILKEDLPDKVTENVQDIQLAGRNLIAVVSDILDFSELQSGKIELEEEAYNITSTINDIINMVMARKDEKHLELIVDCDANIPSALLGDEKKLRRIIINLVDNAIKFTDEGCVTIVIGYRKETYGINLTVTVRDTGIGMDEESLEKLFTSFNQVDASRRRHEGGVGLGLAISNALVQKMGGAITVKSKLGKGSRIRCVIPQKVLDETPIVSIRNRENMNVAIYIDMEQFGMTAIRDEYSRNIVHMVEQLKGKYHICRNFAELQRREQKEPFSHIFISMAEYRAQQAYYDKLADKTKVIVVLDRADEKYVTNPRVRKIYKPFYVLAVASVLNEADDKPKETAASTVEKFVTRGAHVLAVDDNRTNLRVIQGLLTHYKIKVTTATSGKEALEKIMSADYDFVFMDHMMPEMDGVEALHRIRHKVGDYFQRVPIIALTANAVAGAREMLMAEGFSDFLEKPVERSVLERVLKRNLPPEKIISAEEYKNFVEAKAKSAATEEGQTVQAKEKSASSEERQSAAIPKEENRAVEEKNHTTDEFQIEGLDVRKGILYCSGKEQYLAVLRGYCEDCSDTGMLAAQQFEQKDWTNYTITVHGMKSAMHSIGAMELSARAKELELAGKDGRIDFILEHHEELMKEYQSLFVRLRENRLIFPEGFVDKKQLQRAEAEEEKLNEQNRTHELPVLENEAFDRMLTDMEDAMYSLDGAKLKELMAELEKYQYCRKPVREVAEPAKRKVEMSDYISAVELISRWKNKVADEEK